MTPSTPTDRPTGSDPVGALLVQCMEELAQGNHGAIEELCRSHPQHVAEIRERMGILLQMGLVEGGIRLPLTKLSPQHHDLLRTAMRHAELAG